MDDLRRNRRPTLRQPETATKTCLTSKVKIRSGMSKIHGRVASFFPPAVPPFRVSALKLGQGWRNLLLANCVGLHRLSGSIRIKYE
jgi:hypothetical protein